MNRCPNCAAQNREGAKFCTSCGFRLPAVSAPPTVSDRSPFATTSSVPPFADQVTEEPKSPESTEESGFATLTTPPAPEPELPGRSWDAPPPPNTAVPVNEEMIAALVGDAEPAVEEAIPASTGAEHPTWETATSLPSATSEANVTVDHLLKLARELEYGLMELAETPAAVEQGDSRLLSNALADLQDEDELGPLRTAVANAQERPRDVDVMLDLVLRADAIAKLLTERDQLKSAIELSLGGAPSGSTDEPSESSDQADEEPVAEIPADVAQSGDDNGWQRDDESESI